MKRKKVGSFSKPRSKTAGSNRGPRIQRAPDLHEYSAPSASNSPVQPKKSSSSKREESEDSNSSAPDQSKATSNDTEEIDATPSKPVSSGFSKLFAKKDEDSPARKEYTPVICDRTKTKLASFAASDVSVVITCDCVFYYHGELQIIRNEFAVK